MKFEYKPMSGRKVSLDLDGELTNNPEMLNLKIQKFKEEYKVFREDNLSFSEFASDLMKKRKWNSSIFKDLTLLDGATYCKINNKEEKEWSFRTVLAVCVVLELSLQTTETLLKSAGLSFSTSEKQQGYRFLFTEFRGWSIDECNTFLESINLLPLGNSQRRCKNEF